MADEAAAMRKRSAQWIENCLVDCGAGRKCLNSAQCSTTPNAKAPEAPKHSPSPGAIPRPFPSNPLFNSADNLGNWATGS